LKQRFPQVHLKAFTMGRGGLPSKRAKLTIRETLEQLKSAGVDSLPGGGAEIFCGPRAPQLSAITRSTATNGWIQQKLAHQIGLKSNATML